MTLQAHTVIFSGACARYRWPHFSDAEADDQKRTVICSQITVSDGAGLEAKVRGEVCSPSNSRGSRLSRDGHGWEYHRCGQRDGRYEANGDSNTGESDITANTKDPCCVPRASQKLTHLSLLTSCDTGTILHPDLQMKKLRPRAVTLLDQDHPINGRAGIQIQALHSSVQKPNRSASLSLN